MKTKEETNRYEGRGGDEEERGRERSDEETIGKEIRGEKMSIGDKERTEENRKKERGRKVAGYLKTGGDRRSKGEKKRKAERIQR